MTLTGVVVCLARATRPAMSALVLVCSPATKGWLPCLCGYLPVPLCHVGNGGPGVPWVLLVLKLVVDGSPCLLEVLDLARFGAACAWL